jgi:hypothetical protein
MTRPLRVTRRAFSGGLGALVATFALPGLATPDGVIPLIPLSFGIATEDDQPVRDQAWIREQVDVMESLFGPLGVHPADVGHRTLGPRFNHLETRADRDDLIHEMLPGVVNVFIVGTLRDVDEPALLRRGVHWRNRGTPSSRYVILAAEAPPAVLAHEMGHYFGNGHSTTRDNLMSYDRSGGQVFLNAVQGRTIQAAAHEAFSTRELLPAEPRRAP